jgi:tetratricopeptide (TPR) repeat protein
MGETDRAFEMNQRALARDPNFIDAYVQLAVLHSAAGRKAEAEAAIAEAVRRHPEEKQALETILAQIQAQPGT